jgi:hypothetical protein
MVQRSTGSDAGRVRNHYQEADRAELIAAVRRGEPVASAARRLGVTTSTAYTWVRRSPKPPTFIELVTTPVIPPGLTVRIGAAEIDVRPGFDPDLLRATVAALGGAS